jgi:cytochrome c-type biogenesis protein
MNAVALVVALVAGAVSFASPCCLPMVPVYVSYLLGTAPAPSVVRPSVVRQRRAIALRHALVFVVGFGTVFVALWASVGMVGYLLRDYAGVLRTVGGLLLMVFGLHAAGLVEISLLYRQVQLPLRRMLPRRASSGAPASPHYGRSLLLGVVFAAGWTPCVGPILGGIIGLASASGSVTEGTALLICYAIGLGVPFVLVALGVDEISRRMRWFAVHHVGVGLVTGAALMLTGFLLITNLFAKLSGALPGVSL